jgi:hypothetical protein
MRLALLLLLLQGCAPVMKLAYGFKSPEKMRTDADLHRYLERKQMGTGDVYRLSTLADVKASVEGVGVPEVRIFDATGAHVPYGEPGECNAFAFAFLEELDASGSWTTSDEYALDATLDVLRPVGDAPSVDELRERLGSETDFLVVLYWARFVGRLNIDHVRVWERQIAANDKARFDVVKVALDLHEGMTDLDD